MKPPIFQYERPGSVDEALTLLAEHGGEAKVLSGGQSLVPMMNFRLARPEILIDIGQVAGLGQIERRNGLRTGRSAGGGVIQRRIAALTTDLDAGQQAMLEAESIEATFQFEVVVDVAGGQVLLPVLTRDLVGRWRRFGRSRDHSPSRVGESHGPTG